MVVSSNLTALCVSCVHSLKGFILVRVTVLSVINVFYIWGNSAELNSFENIVGGSKQNE